MSERITSFRDLRVYREACELEQNIFALSQDFPPEEIPALAAPLRRAAREIGGQVAAAWSKRRDPDRFRDRLTEADAGLQETRHWIDRAVAGRCLDAARQRELEARCDAIGRMLGTLIRDAGKPRGRDAGDHGPAGDPPAAETRPTDPRAAPPRARPAEPGYGRSSEYSRRP